MKLREASMLAALLVAEISSSVAVTMIYTAMPTLNRVYGNPAGVGWVITACLLVSAAAAALCGRLGDMFGRRRILIIVLAVTACGSTVSALSPSLSGIIAGAALQGVSGAILALCVAVLRERLPAARVPFAVGIVLGAASASAAAGLIVGGRFVDLWGWTSIFWASGAVAATGLGAVLLFVPDLPPPSTTAGVDMVRGVLFVPALTGLLLTINKAKDWGWSNWSTIALGLTSIALMTYWARHQLGQRNPLINLRLLRDRRIGLAYLGISMIAIGTMQDTLVLSMLLQQPVLTGAGFGMSATAAGYWLMPERLVGLLGSPISGKIAEKSSPRSALILGGALCTAGWGLLLLVHHHLWVVLVCVLLQGAGFSIGYAAVPNILVQAAPSERTGEVVGLSMVFRAALSAVGAQLALQVLSLSTIGVPDLPRARFPDEASFRLEFGIIIAASIACAAAGCALPLRARRKAL